MKLILRLYPSAWRRRYGDELSDLLDELPATPSVTLDLVRGAIALHFRGLTERFAPHLVSAGGPPMPTHSLQRHPTATALVAALLVAPTAMFIGFSLLAYQVEVPGLAAAAGPVVDALTRPRVVDLFLLGAPFLGFVVAALPLISLRMARIDGELRINIGLRARTLNLVVLTGCLLVGSLLAWHVVIEFLLERP